MTKFPKATLTAHAAQRLAERFRITADELLLLLNTKHGRKIGRSRDPWIAHRLLWSHVDEALLLAIQDVADGGVVTVLTFEMYRNHYEQNLTDSRIQKVINKMVHAGLAPKRLWKPGYADDQVLVFAQLDDDPKPLSLGAWRGEVRSADVTLLGGDRRFWTWVAERVAEKGNMVDRIQAVHARFCSGDAHDIAYQC